MGGKGGEGIRKLDVTNLTDLSYMFFISAFNDDLSKWDTIDVGDMRGMFESASVFNQSIGGWNTGNVQNLSGMFKNATAFNQDLSAWGDKLTRLHSIENTFRGASAFNNGAAAGESGQPLNWETPTLRKMNYAFADAQVFNQKIFASGASTAAVDNMSGAFKQAIAFNQDIGGWSTAAVKKMN